MKVKDNLEMEEQLWLVVAVLYNLIKMQLYTSFITTDIITKLLIPLYRFLPIFLIECINNTKKNEVKKLFL